MVSVYDEFRLLEKSKGLYNIKGQKKAGRKGVVLREQYAEAKNEAAKISSILYIKDKKATMEREEKINPKDSKE